MNNLNYLYYFVTSYGTVKSIRISQQKTFFYIEVKGF